MTQDTRRAVILSLIGKLRESDSWCGETHLQKATYLLQEMSQVQTGFGFILWKHGPYSFGLHDELLVMQSAGWIELKIADPRYGPRFELTKTGEEFAKKHRSNNSHCDKSVDYMAKQLGDKGVVDLERLATAYYVKSNIKPRTEDLAASICELKPHIPPEKAAEALEAIRVMEAKAPRCSVRA